WRHARDADPGPARQARDELPHSRGVQRRLLGPRQPAHLRVRDPGLRGAGELRAPTDDRRARHGVPAPERSLLLAASDWRIDDASELPRPGWLLRDRLDRLRAVIDRHADR